MATIREFFNTDFIRCLRGVDDWHFPSEPDSVPSTVTAQVVYDFNANAKYWSFYIPNGVDAVRAVNAILNTPETHRCACLSEGGTIAVTTGFGEDSGCMTSDALVYTKRLFVYVDSLLSAHLREQLLELGKQSGSHIVIRDREYAEIRSSKSKPLAFISHDSRDKEDLVRQLASEMWQLDCPVWYDEYSLRVGDSLRESIERGLSETSRCVVILSPNYIGNCSWAKAEFDSIYTREILEGEKIMLPVWHNVSRKQVYDFCPLLADRVGLNSNVGAKELALQLVRAVKSPTT